MEAALRREVKEETGLVITWAEFLFYHDSLPTEEGGMHCVNFYFLCRAEGKITLNEESSDFAWIGPDDLSSLNIVFRNDEALRWYFRKFTEDVR